MSVCVWNMGGPCEGDVSNKSVFSGQIQVPVCASHYNEHLTLMALNTKFGKDIEKLLELSSKERNELLSSLTNDIPGVLEEVAAKDSVYLNEAG